MTRKAGAVVPCVANDYLDCVGKRGASLGKALVLRRRQGDVMVGEEFETLGLGESKRHVRHGHTVLRGVEGNPVRQNGEVRQTEK